MNNRHVALVASMLAIFALDSVHAFSVFIVPLESPLRMSTWWRRGARF